MAKPLPSQEELLELLRYEPETGKLFWKERSLSRFPDERAWKSWNTRRAGMEALTALKCGGYPHGPIFGHNYYAHRVIWKMVHGCTPVGIDHIDGDKGNNRLFNLREVTQAENTRNVAMGSNNTSGTKGVFWTARRKAWVATIHDENGSPKYLGQFHTKELAVTVRKSAEKTYGYHPNHGREVAA